MKISKDLYWKLSEHCTHTPCPYCIFSDKTRPDGDRCLISLKISEYVIEFREGYQKKGKKALAKFKLAQL